MFVRLLNDTMIKQNLIDLYRESFNANSDRAALTDYPTKETFTYLETAAIIQKLHWIFKEAGIEQGDKIALIGKNTARWVIAELSVITYGAVIVPILQDFHAEDINNIIHHSESKLLFVDDAHSSVIDTEINSDLYITLNLTNYKCIYEQIGKHVTASYANIEQLFKEKYTNKKKKEDIVF